MIRYKTPEEITAAFIKDGWNDIHFIETTEEERATYQGWGYKSEGDKPIDFIFTTEKGSNYRVLDDLSEGYVSDHYGIIAEIE